MDPNLRMDWVTCDIYKLYIAIGNALLISWSGKCLSCFAITFNALYPDRTETL